MTLQPFHLNKGLTQAQELAQDIPGCNPLDTNDLTMILRQFGELRATLRTENADVEDCLCGLAERIVGLIERHGHISGRQALSLVVEILGEVAEILGEQVEGEAASAEAQAGEDSGSGEQAPRPVPGEASRLGLRLMDNRKLGEILVSLSMLSQDQVERALKHQKASGRRFGETLIELGLINKAAIDSALRIQRKNHVERGVDPWEQQR